MNINTSLTSNCKVRVLLVPVSPIKRTTFSKYVELVKTFEVVRLGDVTPDLKKGASAMFTSQAFQEGQMHFEFLDHYSREHQELEEFQPYRRIFGIIGIMDCQEWEKKGLKEGHHQFVRSLDHYPSSVVTRCFAFEPSETQEDDTKGLIMMPNVGNMSFYMSTMMCDFASEILELFSVLATSIQSTGVIESPLALNTPIKNRAQQRLSQPPLATPSRTSYISSKRASLPMPSTRVSEEENRSRKRTPGRIQKLLGDFYLLAGRLPDAIHYYDQAIESNKTMSDFLWLTSAMEGWLCATFLLDHLQIDIGHIVSRMVIPSQPSYTSPEQVELPPTPTTPKAPRSMLDLLIEQYSLIHTYYSRVTLTASFPAPDIVFAESCLRIARVLTTAYLNGGWNDTTVQCIMQGELSQGKIKGVQKQSGIKQCQIGDWVTKIWKIRMDQLSLLDQISLLNGMSLIYSCIGYHRKAAWTRHQSVKSMLPLIVQHRRSNLSKDKPSDQGVLDMLKQVCEIYGVGEKSIRLADQGPSKSHDLFGWPALQIEVLKQCISISEALIDNNLRLYYTNVLLRSLYQYIPKAEQIKLATTIQSIIVHSNRDKQAMSSSMNYWGVNLVSSIELKKLISRKAVYAHSAKQEPVKEDKEVSDDPFIYNPFAKKQVVHQKAVLVKNELSEFQVSLLNPFGFDLELQNIVLSTSGVEFEAVPTGTTIPANATSQIQLMGTPKEAGVLIIRGCLIRIIGFAEQEFTVDSKSTKPIDRQTKLKSSGLKTLDLQKDKEQVNASEEEQFVTMDVIDDQPLLKIKRSSLLHGAIMLFEGEVAHMTMDLENIGTIPIDFIALSFVDSTTSNPILINPELLPEEKYEIELYTKDTRVFSCADLIDRRYNQLNGRKIWLPPGEITTIKVNIYGKKDCHHGTIQVDYGFLERSSETVLSLFYTRQLYYNVLVTVYQNLECSSWDVAHLRHSLPPSKDSLVPTGNHPLSSIEDLLMMTRNVEMENQDFCLVTLDVQNTWSTLFDVEFMIYNDDPSKDNGQVIFHLPVQPGSTARAILPIKRLFLPLDVCQQTIPSLDVNRQFVVSQGPKLSKEQQQARLQIFWYREELLSRIKASWRCRVSQRTGDLNLRPSLRFSQTQLAIFKKEDIEFSVDMKGQSVTKLSGRRFICECNDPTIMTITVKNRFPYPIKVILRLQPVQSYNDGAKEYDLSEKLLVEGIGQVVLPEIPAIHGQVAHSFPLYFLSRGQFELLYHAEDVYKRKIYYDHEWVIVDTIDSTI